jgi:phosphoribosylformimino-5-aminoimidazole carboxamide ribotide isomerase
MNIIPVIDLMHGEVVHARFGQRQNYQAIQSQLCNSSAPIDIVNALLELYAFKHLYIADLDAITNQGDHLATIVQLQELHPNLEIWLDAGIKNTKELAHWNNVKVTHVIGSENLAEIRDLTEISKALDGRFILSLDFNQAGFLGPEGLQNNTTDWPQKLILMTLNRVGSNFGADTEKLTHIRNIANGREVFAAGGISNDADIDALNNLNISGVLVATALHNKQIDPAKYTKGPF